MSEAEAFFLYEAVLTLYPAAGDGQTLTGGALWWGSLARGLRLGLSLEEVVLKGSGDRYGKANHVDEEHVIEIERTWVLPRATGGVTTDFRPGRNQQYVLEMVWTSQRGALAQAWYKRTYYGVTGRTVRWDSQGPLEILSPQTWRAQRFTEASGAISGGAVVPIAPAGVETPVGFFREATFIVGEYLLGVYRWGAPVTVTSARLVGQAGQGTNTTVGLEIDGALTGVQVTAAAGPANTEVSAEVTGLSQAIAAGSVARWKIVSGPADPADAMWIAGLVMQVKA